MLTVRKTGTTAAMQRMFTDAQRAALEDAVEYWHANFLPIHFTEEGFTRYNYQPRKGQGEPNLVYSEDQGRGVRQGKRGRLINNPKYYWRKWRWMKTHDPLVFTGDSRKRAEQSIRVSTVATNRGATIRGQGVMDLPKYFYQYDKSTGAPDKADELLRTTSDEDAELSRVYNEAVGRHLAAASAPPVEAKIA